MNDYQNLLQEHNILSEVQELIRKKEQISAIKLVKDTLGLGLKESKEIVDHLLKNEFINLITEHGTKNVSRKGSDENSIEEQVRNLLHQNKKLEAVKLVYDTGEMNLKNAKDFVESIERKESIFKPKPANHFERNAVNHPVENKQSTLFVESNSSGKWILFCVLFCVIMLLLYFFYYKTDF